MSSSTPVMTRKPVAALTVMLSFAAAAATQAASTIKTAPTATSAQTPIEELQELDEIWIRGKSLSDMIEDAEDVFVRRYNKVNKKNDFDVVCDYLRLDRNSLALTRTCVPYFIGYLSMESPIPWTPSFACTGGYITDGSISFYGGRNVGTGISSYDYYGTSCSSVAGPFFPAMSTPTIVRRPANSYTDNMRQDYLRNVMRAIYRDQALLDKATTLAALYQEMKTVQDHYQKIKAEDDARREEERRLRREQRRLHLAPAAPNRGPRI